MADSLLGRLFPRDTAIAHSGSLLSRLFPSEEEKKRAETFKMPEAVPESGLLEDLRAAPAAPAPDATPIEETQARLDRQKWERDQASVAARTAADVDALAEQRRQEGLSDSYADYATNFGGSGFAPPPGEINIERGKERAADYTQRTADDDPLSTVATKWVQNLPERAQRWLAGLSEAGTYLPTPGQLVFGKTELDRRYEAAIRQNSREMFAEATEELKRNAPNVEADSGALFAYDAANAFLDMGVAAGATIATRSPAVGAAIQGGQVFGDKFGESRSAGRTPEQALMDASFHGAAEFIGERVPLKVLMRPGGTFLGKVGRTAAAESIQEAVTEGLQTAYDAGVIGEEMTFGEAFDRMKRAGMIGGVVGGGVGAVSHPFTRDRAEGLEPTSAVPPASPLAPDPLFGAPQPPARVTGVVEAAERAAAQPTEGDIRSPIPTELIAKGKAMVEGAKAATIATGALRAAGLPGVGKRVVVDYGGGRIMVGTVADVYERDDPQLGKASGIRINLDDGGTFDEMLPDIEDAGVSIEPIERALSVPKVGTPSSQITTGLATETSRPDGAAEAPGARQEASSRAPSAVALPRSLPVDGPVTSPFGRRKSPKAGASTDHGGVDIGVPENSPVHNPLPDGIVLHTGSGGARGNWVELDHGGGVISRYFHLKGSDVTRGDRVNTGEVFARSGATGNVTGPHLHWSVLKDGVAIDPLSERFDGGPLPDIPRDPAEGSSDGDDASYLNERLLSTQEAPFAPPAPETATTPPAAGETRLADRIPAAAVFGPAAAEKPQISAINEPGRVAPAAGVAAAPIIPEIIPEPAASDFLAEQTRDPLATTEEPAVVGPRRIETEQTEGGRLPAISDFATVRVGNSEFPFTSLKEVSEGYRGTIERLGIGGSKTPPAAIYDAEGRKVAYVAYNGRIFGVDERGETDLDRVLYETRSPRKPVQIEVEKSKVVIRHADGTEMGAIRDALPKGVAPLPRSDGAFILPKKYESAVRAAVGTTTEPSEANQEGGDRPLGVSGRTAGMPVRQREPLPDLEDNVRRASPIRDRVAITPTGRELPVRYAVVEADRLITSNTEDGAANPEFPADLQPRDRSRGTSQAQISSIAANLDPRLLGPSPKASDGAPVIDPSGVVLSGNGRSLAIRRAYGAGGPQAARYREYLTEQGVDITGMERPILVRVGGENMAPADIEAFTREANQRDTLDFSATEQAAADARQIPDTMLDLYRGGDVDAASNREFVRAFIGKVVGPNERAALIAPDGSMSQGAVSRIRTALLAKAYDNNRLVTQMAEATDTNIKAIGSALTDVAGAWARKRIAATEGRISPDLDATRYLNEAVGIVEKARRESRQVSDYVSQTDIFSGTTIPPETEAFLRLMYAKPNFTKPVSRERLADALRFYVDQAMMAAPGGGLFGDQVAPATPLSIAALAKDRQDGTRSTGQADFLRAASSVPSSAVRSEPPVGADRDRSIGADVSQPSRGSLAEDVGEPAGGAAASLQRRVQFTPAERLADPSAEILAREGEIRAVHDATAPATTEVASARAVFAEIPADPPLDDAAARLWGQARVAMQLTGEEQAAAKRDARAIAALAGQAKVGRVHVAEALSYVSDWRERAKAGQVRQERQGARSPLDVDALKREAQARQVSGRGRKKEPEGEDAFDATVRQGAIAAQVDQLGEDIINLEGMKELMSRAARSQAQLHTFVGLGLNRARNVQIVNPGHKSRARILEKVRLEGYTSPDELKDIARMGFIVKTVDAAENVVAKIKAAFPIVQDKGWQTNDHGYLDRKIIVRTQAGLMAEMQIVPEPIWKARKSGTGKLYSKWRTLRAGPEADALLGQMRADYSAAMEGSEFTKLSSASRSAFGKSSAASPRESGTPSLFASPGAATQASSRQTQAEPPAPRSTTPTSRPSISSSSSDTERTSDTNIELAARRGKRTPSANRIFTDEAAERARETLRKKFQQLNSGLDPELAQAGITLAGYHIERGARTFAAYAEAMIADLGDAVRPYLRGWYEAVRFHPGMEDAAAEMSGPEDIGAALADLNRGGVTPSTNRGTSVPQEARRGVQGSLFEGDVGAGSRDVQPAPEDGGAQRPRRAEEPGSPPTVRPARGAVGETAERGREESGRAAGDRGTGALDFDRVPERAAEAGDGRRADTPAEPSDSVATENWRIEPGALEEGRGAAQKARDNLRAVEIVKELDESGKPATVEQQAALAKYVGWGGLKNAFAENEGAFPKGFESIGPRLKELLSPAEYDTARRSIQYAHYTAEKVVRPMWEAARRLGFRGGKVFEPGVGTGNFLGMMPADLAAVTTYSGIEFDYITARIAQLLYPKAGIQHADFTRQPMPKNAFDLIIGNPPFSGTTIRSDPEYAREGFVMHDFFFAKSLDSVRPGGLLMFVTSAGTMNKIGTEAREWMAERADLVGAVRLPGDAFQTNAGTKVTTDIVILRKKDASQKAEETPWAGDRSWIGTSERELPEKDGTLRKGQVNSYFDKRPEMVLGEEGFFDLLIGGDERRYAVRSRPGTDLSQELAKALESLPAGVMTAPNTQLAADGTEFGGRERKDGSFYLAPDGTLMQQRGNLGVPVEGRGKGVKGGIPAKDQERIRALIPVRDALRAVFDHDLNDRKAEGDAARAKLNREYDAFVTRFGPINKAEFSYRRPTVIQIESARSAAREEMRLGGGFFDEGSFDPGELIRAGVKTSEIAARRRIAKEAADALGREWDEGTFDPEDMPDTVIVKRPNIDPFMDDQEGYRLRAIEHYNDDNGEAKKGAIFFENIISKEREPKIDSANDALLYTLNRLGRPDLDEIAFRAGMSRSQVLEELSEAIFLVPDAGETYQTRELYLSGNVRAKLETARAAAARDPAFNRNVAALEAVQPTPLGPADISANLGMPWIPTDVIEEFGKSLGLSRVTARYRGRMAQWSVDGDRISAAARSEWGTSDRDAISLLSDALNRQDPKVHKKVRDPETGREKDILDPEATQAAQDKMRDIKARFVEWVWGDPKRADRLAALYNRDYNNLVAPVYDGSYLTTPGIASTWRWRPHQSRVVARIIQSGNTYMAHGVGAGKTSAMIGAGMEMRRLGLVKKPMYVVPNHMLGQFTKEFYEQYPTAKIMVADERQFHTDRRKQFVANMAAEDLDAVIITHSAFGFIPMSDAFIDNMIQQQLDDYRDILAEVKAEVKAGEGRGDRFTQRRIEQQIESMQQKLSGRLGKKDQVFTFEETGIDFLFVDEAHLFRKLDFATKMGSVRGIDPNGSQASYDLYAKTRYLEGRSPNRSHVLASGTAITNTMAELFTVSRYLQPGALAERGLSQFDAWAGAFGETVTALEQDPAGGYKPQTRFARFVNVPELSSLVRQIMDVVTSKQLEEYVVRPKIKGGKRQMVLARPTPELESLQKDLERRMRAIQQRTGPPKKGDDILLSVIGDGRKAAIDMRLVNPRLPRNEESKLEQMIARVFDTWKATKQQPFHRAEAGGYSEKPYRRGPATQMVFSDLGINGEFPIHKYIQSELIRRGVPRAQVAVISDFKSHVARQRLFNDMNEGKVRILIGSVPKMGTGVNAQRQLYAIHNLDPQWYPANDEQRNGRGLRQGNENPEIEITDYSTKGTYDSTMWGMMESKARFIEGFFAGDPTMRSMDDLGEASQYEQAKAITTADPRILELTQYKQDLERGMIRRAAHEREQYALRERIRDAEDRIERQKARIPEIQADIAERQDIAGDKFTAQVGDKIYTDRAEFGAAVIERMEVLAAERVSGRDMPVGEIGGFRLTADVLKWDKNWTANLYLNRNGDQQDRVKADTDTGVAASATAIMRGFEADLERARDSIERNRRTIAEFTPQVGKRFAGQAEIDDLQKRVDTLEAVLTAEAAAKALNTSMQPRPEPEVKEAREKRGAGAAGDAATFSAATLEAAMKAELERVGIADRVTLNATTQLWGDPEVWGRYSPQSRIIAVAIDRSPDAMGTLNHEIVHALRDLSLFRSAEWTALASKARSDEKLWASVQERYPDLSEEQQIEEAVADMYAKWRGGSIAPKGFVRVAFERVRAFLDAIRAALTRAGIRAEDVMAMIGAGQLGARTNENLEAGAGPDRFSIGRSAAAPDPVTVGAILRSTTGLRSTAAEKFDAWRTAAQDRMLPLLRTQQAAERVLGRSLREDENPYIGEELMSGRVGAQLERLADGMVGPLFEAMEQEEITADELESYLYARHAPERNEQIAKINPEFADGRGSGMSDIEASAIIGRIRKAGRLKQFERVAERVDAILTFAVDTRLEAGLLSEEQVEAWRSTYKHYVPLRGFAELDGAEGDRLNDSGGINVRGAESKRAFGRRSKADDILAYSIMQAEEAIIRAEKNMVAQQFYELAQAAPDPEFWSTNKVTMKRQMNPLTGQVELVPVRNLLAVDKDWTVSLKIEGKERRVTMNRNNPAARRLAQAMRRLDEQQVGKVVQFFGKVNRWLSAANTSFNPEFVITNAFRDIQTAGINLAGFDKKGLIAGTLKDYRKALAGSMRGAFKSEKGDAEWGRWYQEYLGAGGRVFFNQVQDIEALRKDIERRVSAMGKKKLTPATLSLQAKGAFTAIGGFIGAVNNGVENAIRLSAYKNARERGMSKVQAASLAKNLTTNFNRRGSAGQTLNAAYLFYNASIQGTVRLLLATKSPRVRKLLAGIVVTGAAVEVLNMMVSGVDDDDELYYDKISEFDKSRNLIIMIPGAANGQHLKIPLPYGYNTFYAIGRSAIEIARGKSAWNTLGNLAGTIVDSFNPIGGTGNLLSLQGLVTTVSPTVTDPIVELVTNKDFAERPIMPNQNPFGPPTPENQRYWASVNPVWRKITDTLNTATGGDEIVPGWVDVSPEVLEHLFGVVTGAAGAFYDRTLGLGVKGWGIASGDETVEIERNDIPLVRKLIGEKPGWYDKSAYYARADEVEQAINYAKSYAERGDREGFVAFVDKNLDVVRLEPALKRAQKHMRRLRKERNRLELGKDAGKVDAATYRERSRILGDIEKRIMADFNAVYMDSVETPAGPS